MHNGRRPIRGRAFYEKLRFDEAGQPLVTTFMDCLIPTTMEIPPIEIHNMESRSSLNPVGRQGRGRGRRDPGAIHGRCPLRRRRGRAGTPRRVRPRPPPRSHLTVLAMIEGEE